MRENRGVKYKFTMLNGEEYYQTIYRRCEITAFMKVHNAVMAEQVDNHPDEDWGAAEWPIDSG